MHILGYIIHVKMSRKETKQRGIELMMQLAVEGSE